MRYLLGIVVLLAALSAQGVDLEWVEIGADTEGVYFIDPRSIEVDGETIRVRKRQVFNAPLVDNFTGRQVLFKESVGIVEVDCGRHINRVTQIEMIGMNGEIVWSSGKMDKRLWEDVRENTHGQTTFDYLCKELKKS